MFPGEDSGFDNDYGVNPYESFMRKHLQHYGYYTGKNQNYKNHFHQYAEWEKNYAYDLRGSSSESDSDSDDDDDKNDDSKLQDDLLRTTQLIYSFGESGKMVPKLREPRSLYALNKELGPQQAARWPSNLQVINERVRHLQQVAPEPEPMYKNTGYEKCPMARGEANGGRVVFSYETNASFFMKSRVGGSRNGCDQCAVPLTSEEDQTLIFESRFESGNLGKAVEVNPGEYELWLHYDLYTNKHTQWFYFRVANTRANKQYRFTIVNFIKPDSLYNNGMRPVMYSEKEAALNKVGWVRGGENIKYYRNNLKYEANRVERSYYSMTFTVTLKHDHDTVYFSHCYPYTYTDLQDYLLEMTNDPIKSRICRQRVLCRTLAGNLVYVLTITGASQKPEEIKHKKAVVVTSRVHPGESNASWMMKGFLDFVTGNSPDAKLLRDTFIFKVVPMLNPDGVIVGNYRCSLAGRDLNRNYKTSLKDAYPSVWHTKNMIRKLLQERDIIVYCDLHGHSRRQNVFIYGCEQKYNSNKRFHERIFPSMLNKNCPDKFCFNACKFKVQKSKEGTGRVVMWNMGVMNSYTLEATFCGSSLGKKKGFHFSQHDYEMMGYHFCDTLLDYCDPDNTKYANIMVDLEHRHQMEVMAKIAAKGLEPEQVVDLSDSDIESSDGGSDSSVSDGPPVHLQFAASRAMRDTKKKRLKSKKERDTGRPHQKDQKDDARKGSIQEDKRIRNNQIKPLKHDSNKNHSIRYTNTSSPRQARSTQDERAQSGIPTFVQERVDEKNQKRHDYLEALTAAYVTNNIPIVNDPELENRPSTCPSKPIPTVDLWTGACSKQCIRRQQTVVHFRYSGSEKTANPSAGHESGLCPRHEQNLHAQLSAMQQQAGGDNRGASIKPSSGVQAQYERMRAPYTESDEFELTLRDLQLQRLTPKWLMEEACRIRPLIHVCRAGDGNPDDQVGLTHTASIPSTDRRHKPHLLEVSAAQQRQTDLLSRDKNGPIKTHPNPFDEKGDTTQRSTTNIPKAQVPSATSYVNYNTFNVAQVPKTVTARDERGEQGKTDGHRQRNGRKSRKGMRDDDEEDNRDNQYQGPVFDVKAPAQPHTPRVQSAQSSSQMAATLSSIQEIQKSLQGAKPEESPGAGEYIQQLIKETNEEIVGLTNEIQEDIEKKHPRSKHIDQNNSKDNSSALQKLKTYNNKKKAALESKSAQRSPLGIGYHGNTFVSELGTKGGKNHGGGHLSGKPLAPSAATPTQSASQTPVNSRPSLVARPGEYVPYMGSTFNSNITKFHGGPNLMVSSDNHSGRQNRETILEEEARTRSLKRQQSSQNTAVRNYYPSTSNHSDANSSNNKQPKQETLEYTCYTPTNENNNTDTESNSHGIRQYSSASGYRSNHSASSVRLSKKTLMFRNGGPETGVKVQTPRESQLLVDPDGLGDGNESRSRSARSGIRQVVEAVPTKISLMICNNNDHPETSPAPGGQFKPLSRQGRQTRRKK